MNDPKFIWIKQHGAAMVSRKRRNIIFSVNLWHRKIFMVNKFIRDIKLERKLLGYIKMDRNFDGVLKPQFGFVRYEHTYSHPNGNNNELKSQLKH